jgi:sec-independent protein translocase protein TatA
VVVPISNALPLRPNPVTTMSFLPLSILLGMIGPWQIVLVVVVLLLLFGGKKIPELMRGLGQGMKEFKDASKDLKDDSKSKDETKS